MTITYTYKLQGNGKDSWIKTVTEGQELISKEMFYGDINNIEPSAIVIGGNAINIYKKRKKLLIDKKTEELLIGGFTYNNTSFGLKENEKTKWLALSIAPITKYPINIVSKEGILLTLRNSIESDAFYNSAFDRARFIEEQGGILKYQVNQCTTTDQVDAVNDNRV